ncbi:MAG: hypothetical protein IPP07_09600 [Holophagales bacterium]|nr:hypothetical protein [Holophagales bacterium]MBK9965123.1 hypothetical protein [Holophagales bacterium]
MGVLLRSLLLSIVAFAVSRVAFAQKTGIKNVEPGEVCFTGATCVKVDSAYGELYDGSRYVGSEWIVGVRDSSGRQVDKVGKGGDIQVISPDVYARRNSQEDTYTIHRIDKSAKAVKTRFRVLFPGVSRVGFDNWAGRGGTAIGMTALPPQDSMGGGMTPVGGDLGAVTPAGEVTPLIPGVRFAFRYGDYRILAHTDNRSYSIADADYRPLSPKLENVVSFRTDFSDQIRMAFDTVETVFAIPVTQGETGARVLFNILPYRKGQIAPAGLIGLAPLLENGGISCGPKFDATCRQQLQGWIGVWAGENGPEVSLEGPLLLQTSVERFKSIEWDDLVLSSVGVVEELRGGFGLRIYTPGRGGEFQLSVFPQKFSDRASAVAAAAQIRTNENAAIQAAYAAVRNAERAKYEAWQAAQAAEEARRAERAAAEDAEVRKAKALIAEGDADKICGAWLKLGSFYARTNLADECRRLRPPPKQASRGFWGDLASGLAAYNRAVASGQASAPPAAASGGAVSTSPGDADFARSMRSIDNALRVIGDPNWNGAAGAARR